MTTATHQQVQAAKYMTTAEAAEYLRRSVTWVLAQKDIPRIKGVPCVYLRADLDEWFERRKKTA